MKSTLRLVAVCGFGLMAAAGEYGAMPVSAQARTGAPAKPQPSNGSTNEPARFGIGRPATPAEIAALDIDVGPDGAGLPPGRGCS